MWKMCSERGPRSELKASKESSIKWQAFFTLFCLYSMVWRTNNQMVQQELKCTDKKLGTDRDLNPGRSARHRPESDAQIN